MNPDLKPPPVPPELLRRGVVPSAPPQVAPRPQQFQFKLKPEEAFKTAEQRKLRKRFKAAWNNMVNARKALEQRGRAVHNVVQELAKAGLLEQEPRPVPPQPRPPVDRPRIAQPSAADVARVTKGR